jgi:hypothetical protein
MKEIKLEEIQPVGNFKETLLSLKDKTDIIIDNCNNSRTYNASLANALKFILTCSDVLKDGIINNDG